VMDTNDLSHGSGRSSAGTSPDQHKIVVCAWMDAWNTGDLDAAEALLDEGFVRHDANVPDVVGRDAQREFISAVLVAFPDLRFEAQLVIAEGDIVMSRLRGQGTHQGEFMGVPPSGRAVDFQAVETYRLCDDKIAEQWVLMDALGLFQQLGAIPTV
jgi:steroid delta-isomerase-like uncharacterized protein